MDKELPIKITFHAYEQMKERGVLETEVSVAIRQGELEPAESGRHIFRKNFQFKKSGVVNFI